MCSLPEVVRVVAGRQPEFTAGLVAAAAEGARRNPAPSAQATADLVAGVAANDPDLLMEAVALYERSPRRLAAAGAATHAVRVRCVPPGAAPRPPTTTSSPAGGTRPPAPRATSTGCAVAGGRRRRGTVLRPTVGWESLTRSEREVVDLLQDGLTNRQIGDALGISRRTVETHLSHAFTKVGVSTRVQLAAEAAKLR